MQKPSTAESSSLPDEASRAAADRVRDDDLDEIVAAVDAELSAMSGAQLLITGGAGFLGYYLVQAALRWNDKGRGEPISITVFDNYLRGAPGWLAALDGRPDLVLTRHDVREPLAPGAGPWEYVIHAAGIASPTVYRSRPLEMMDANVNGLRFLLDASSGWDLKGFLFFSSSEIYGDPVPDAIPTPETYRGNVSCTGPRACYDESKRYGETLCVTFAGMGLPVSIARPFNNYGPGMKITDGRVIADFSRNVVRGEDIVMYSDGSPRRTFCYVADAVAGYYKTLIRGRPGEPYNIGVEGPEISMLELAELIVAVGADTIGYRGEVVRRVHTEANYLVDNPNRRCPDITEARTELGYAPQVSLRDGLRRTLVWYAGQPAAAEG